KGFPKFLDKYYINTLMKKPLKAIRTPKIYTDENDRRYIILSKKRIYISNDLTEKQIIKFIMKYIPKLKINPNLKGRIPTSRLRQPLSRIPTSSRKGSAKLT
ncbi:MAG: hypothetical protein P4L31_04070, partial [Candidatus Babeliales bacterium]|nr:hypothetical protein [Candidatus Babeliales bacterium]